MTAVRRKRGSWWRILLGCLVAYAVGIVLLLLTQNANLFPTVVMIGNFMVPAAYVSFFYERRHLSRLTMGTTMLSFLYGGLLGVFAASILEPLLIRGMTPFYALVVGLLEEFVKILGVLVIARRRKHDSALDGLVLGAAAGMGFAALESMGYAFTAFMSSRGSLSATVYVTLLRGILSPVGHGTWTAILVGVLFRESAKARYHINRKVIGAYLTVAVLHGLWDGLPMVIQAVVPANMAGMDVVIGQTVVGALSLFLLWRRWRDAVRVQEAALLQAETAEMPPTAAPAEKA